jgi:uncharacterized membrane protein YbhN (UPF0104 family)
VESAKALWIGYFEILMEVYVGCGLGLVAAVYALSRGAVVIGSSIALVATIIIIGYTFIFIVPALKNIKVPHGVFSIASRLVGGERATAIYLRTIVSTLNFSLAARAIVKRENVPVVIKVVGLTIIEDFLAGTALWLVLTSAGLKIDPLSSVLAVYGVAAIAQLPISIGGAGITELTMQAYLIALYKFTSWASIVLWRIATYQVMLAYFCCSCENTRNMPSRFLTSIRRLHRSFRAWQQIEDRAGALVFPSFQTPVSSRWRRLK